MTTIKQEHTLPPEKVFSIQTGTELFRLSGASISSDAPSYFSQFFEKQIQNGDASLRTLYIDRDPGTFQEIARHLQGFSLEPFNLDSANEDAGYHVRPKDSTQFVKLFADAQFYSLPRLTSQLFESDIFVQIGGRQFQIPRDIFSSPGDSPNFFSLGFADFFASPSEVFPGLDRTGLLRPPAIEPPSVPNRSGDVFAELLHMLRGYPLEIRSEVHREQLLRDCRYYHLRGLEQRLIPHDISYNPITQRSEIVVRLEDLRPSGLDFIDDVGGREAAWAAYARPFRNEQPHDLIVEIGGETILDHLTRAKFSGDTSAQVASFIQSTASKFAPDAPLMAENEDAVQITILHDADVTVNGFKDDTLVNPNLCPELPGILERPSAKRPRLDGAEDGKWFMRRGQWRVRVWIISGRVRVSLFAVKLDLYTEQKEWNRARGFVGG